MKFPVELQYGDFGCADPEVEKKTEQTTYNVKIMMWISKDTSAEVYITVYHVYNASIYWNI